MRKLFLAVLILAGLVGQLACSKSKLKAEGGAAGAQSRGDVNTDITGGNQSRPPDMNTETTGGDQAGRPDINRTGRKPARRPAINPATTGGSQTPPR